MKTLPFVLLRCQPSSALPSVFHRFLLLKLLQNLNICLGRHQLPPSGIHSLFFRALCRHMPLFSVLQEQSQRSSFVPNCLSEWALPTGQQVHWCWSIVPNGVVRSLGVCYLLDGCYWYCNQGAYCWGALPEILSARLED